MAATFKMPTVYKGSNGPHVAMVQGFLNYAECTDADGNVLKCDGDAGTKTMYAVEQYIKRMKANGIDLGSPDGFGPLCYKSIGLDPVS